MPVRAYLSAALVAILGIAPATARAAVAGQYLYQLSDSTGPVTSSWASLAYDARHKELYVVDRQDGSVAIFNDVGMEIYRFGQDSEIGTIASLAVMDDGDLLALVFEKDHPVIHRCNFRGEAKQRIELRKMPPEFASDFWPDTIVFRGGKIYLAHKGAMKVLVADPAGNTLAAHDFFRELGLDKVKTARGGIPAMHAFNVDGDGDLLFTVAPMFKVFVVSPEGKVSSFGEHGGAPGKFNITGGVTRDDRGNVFVTDVLKSAVLVFNDKFEFVGQFGERGWDRGDLIAPLEIAVGDGKVFVAQSATRGVSVFQVTLPDPGGTATAAVAPANPPADVR